MEKDILLSLHAWSATQKDASGEGTTYMVGGIVYPTEPDQIALGVHDGMALTCMNPLLPHRKPWAV